MKNLAIDTTSSICGVALLEDDNIIDEILLDNGMTHSENLNIIIKEILEKNKLNLNDLDFLSCTVGPGSFTGIRIGVACVKAFAEIYDLKIASVLSLESLAMNIKDNFDVKVSMIDARNDQVYFGIYDNNINKIKNEIADDINIVLNEIKGLNNICFVGNGASLHSELIEKFCIENNIKYTFSDKNYQCSSSSGLVGYKKYLNNDLKNADNILPVYLRKSQAERMRDKN